MMARYSVLKEFSTPTRRFYVGGEERDEHEFDGPVSIERWVELGFLEPAHDADEEKVEAARRAVEQKVAADQKAAVEARRAAEVKAVTEARAAANQQALADARAAARQHPAPAAVAAVAPAPAPSQPATQKADEKK